MCGEHRVHGKLRALFGFADISPGEPEAAGLQPVTPASFLSLSGRAPVYKSASRTFCADGESTQSADKKKQICTYKV